MALYHGASTTFFDANLLSNNSVSIQYSNFENGSTQYKIYVDDTLVITTANTTATLNIANGSDNKIVISAYSNNALRSSIQRYVRLFTYSNTEQTWTVPNDVRFVLCDVQGARGGGGGLGGRMKGYINTNPGETLYVYCGGRGKDLIAIASILKTEVPPPQAGGFNGGGTGGRTRDDYNLPAGNTRLGLGSSGGGASDIRRISGDYSSRIIVAGGAGGGHSSVAGGAGGGQDGANGGFAITTSLRGIGANTSNAGSGGTGGNVNGTSGSFGQGGNGADIYVFGNNPGRSGGGGGGYYGGGGGSSIGSSGGAGGGGGGSGYITPVLFPLVEKFGTYTQGYRNNDGAILLTWL